MSHEEWSPNCWPIDVLASIDFLEYASAILSQRVVADPLSLKPSAFGCRAQPHGHCAIAVLSIGQILTSMSHIPGFTVPESSLKIEDKDFERTH
jgi:hypothetical protein